MAKEPMKEGKPSGENVLSNQSADPTLSATGGVGSPGAAVYRSPGTTGDIGPGGQTIEDLEPGDLARPEGGIPRREVFEQEVVLPEDLVAPSASLNAPFTGGKPGIAPEGGPGRPEPSMQPGRPFEESGPRPGSTGDKVREKAEDIRGKARDTLSQAKEQAKGKGQSMLSERKDWAAGELDHLSGAVRNAAGHLHEKHDDALAEYTESLAERVDRAAQYVRARPVGDLVHDAQELARKRPEIFLGGLFLAGIAAARFLRSAGSPKSDPYRGQYSDPEFEPSEPLSYHDELFQGATGR